MADENIYWEYEAPPTLFDTVQDNFLSAGIRKVIHFFVRLSFRYYHRFEIVHQERLQLSDGFILAANHASHLDTLAVFCAFPLKKINRLRPLAAKDYFFVNPIVRCLAFFFANVIPMERKQAGAESIVFAGKKLQEGNDLLIFPEGTRTDNGEIKQFHPGIGILALKFDVPVVPLYIQGTFESQSRGMILPRPEKIRLVIGEAVHYKELSNTKENWQKIAADLETRVRQLKSEVIDAERDQDQAA
jgi:1-acyl-sn-glycerol-3-phosphate acyltransferase